jgi:hypothetical protein
VAGRFEQDLASLRRYSAEALFDGPAGRRIMTLVDNSVDYGYD